jgi:galactokinase
MGVMAPSVTAPARRTATWSAPGRINLIGEHLDYNGGPVLPLAIARRTTVTVTARSDRRVIIRSGGLGRAELPDELTPGAVNGWERYVAASLWAFADAVRTLPGLDILVSSAVPIGAGLASSAAVECAVLSCLDEMAGSGLSRKELALLALHAEREFVGVPCGPMDQLAAMLSQPDRALHIDTRTLDTCLVPLALTSTGLALVVIDTRVEHALSDGTYADRQGVCRQAAEELGLAWLTDASADQLDQLADPVVRRRARHVVSECERVEQVAAALREDKVVAAGPLLTESHRSLADDFEVSCPELDTAVSAALTAGALGARMTGAGFGGCAIALCRAVDVEAVSSGVRRAFDDVGFATPETWTVTPADGARRPNR